MNLGPHIRHLIRKMTHGARPLFSALVLGAVLLPAILYAVVAWQDRISVLQQAEQDIKNTVGIMGENAHNVFGTHILVARLVNEHIQGMSWSEISDSEALHKYLAEVVHDNPQILSLWLVDSSSPIRDSSAIFPTPPAKVADRDYFTALCEHDAGFFIGWPVHGRVFKSQDIFSAAPRRLRPSGSFDRVVDVSALPSCFTDFWKLIADEPRATAALIRSDGVILARKICCRYRCATARCKKLDHAGDRQERPRLFSQQFNHRRPRADQPDLLNNDGHVSAKNVAGLGGRSAARAAIGRRLASRCLCALAALARRRHMAIPFKSTGAKAPNITTCLLILLAVAVLPLLTFSTFLVVYDAVGNRAKQLQQFRVTNHVMSLGVDAEIERQLAVAFTLRNAVVAKDLDRLDFYNLAKATVADVPDVRIYLYANTGRMLATTMLPYGAELPMATAPEIIQRVVDTTQPYVSDLLKDPVSKTSVTQVFVPVVVDGEVTSVIAIGYPPSRISDVLRERLVSQDGIGVVFDRTGKIIARTRGEEVFLGRSVVPELIAGASASKEGVFEANSLEGIAMRGTFIKSARTGWTTSLAIPWHEVNEPLVRSLTLLGGAGAVLILIVSLTTILYGRSIARPLIKLSEMAIALGHGEPLPPRNFAIKEVQEIADRLRSSAAELHRRNAALLKQTIALDVANKELEGFAYSTSHVLRAPLRAIDGFSQILLDDHAAGLDSEGRRLVGVLRASSLDINEQIDGILEFLQLGRDTMSRDRIVMAKAVQMALKTLEAHPRNCQLTIEVLPLPDAFGDPAMIRRVWANLLDNAIKFTVPRDNAAITVGAATDESNTIYFVRDNGVGFDMRYVGKLFGVFNRLHGADFCGNGMGLAIVQRIVFRHGGRVWAEGKPGEGATFYFSLPVAEQFHD